MIWKGVLTKNWKTYENEKQFARNAENLTNIKENDKTSSAKLSQGWGLPAGNKGEGGSLLILFTSDLLAN